MSRRRTKRAPTWGKGKHRKARVQRFKAKHPDFLKKRTRP